MGEPLATLAQIRAYNDWDFPGAEEDYKRAITLSPNYPPARQWYAQFLDWMGRLDEAMVQIEIGQQLDPLSLIMSTDRAEILLHMDKFDAATVQIKKVVELNPAFETAPFVWGEIYEREGKYDAALAEYKEGIRLTGQAQDYEGVSVVFEARLRAEAGRKKEAAQLLARAEKLIAKRPPPEPCGQALASAYAALGDKNHAFLWLERDYSVRWPAMITLKMDRELDPLRNDPRFPDLLKRVGFQQ
jgi:adenylate cyclase